MMPLPTLETTRLILRPFSLNDASTVKRLAGDKAIADTTLNIPHPYEDGMAETWIGEHQGVFEDDKGMTLAITLRDTGALVGAISLSIHRRFDHAEMGYWVGKPFWNNGYCTEAVKAVLMCGFTDLRLNRIFAHYIARNDASGRVMEKVGMVREGYLRQHVLNGGTYEDLYIYGALKADYTMAAR